MNGHEHLLGDTLQYACIYPLEEPHACDGVPDCECAADDQATNVVCQADDGSYSSVQRFGRATPATRQLSLIRELPARGVVGSICTSDDFNPESPAFAFRPAVDAMMRAVRRSLVKP